MSVYNRKLFFNRGGQVNGRGTGITSGLAQPVQRFQTGGTVDPMAKARQVFYAGLMSGKSKQPGNIGSILDILGQSMGAATQFMPDPKGADEYFWAYNTKTGRYERVTEATFNPEVHTKDAPAGQDSKYDTRELPVEGNKIQQQETYDGVNWTDIGVPYDRWEPDQAQAPKMSDEKSLWLETDPTPDTPVTDEDKKVMGTFPEFLEKIDKIKTDEPPTYDKETINVFTLDKDNEFTVPNQITKFTEGNNVMFKDNNNNVITGDEFIMRGDDKEEDYMWVYNTNLGYNDWIPTNQYDSTIHRKEAPEQLKGFEYKSIDDIDGKKYAIFVNPNLQGEDSVRKVEIGNADPSTIEQGSIVDNTFQGLDGYEYEKYVENGVVKARKIPGQLAPKDDGSGSTFADKTSVKGTIMVNGKDVPATFTQTAEGWIITNPLPTYTNSLGETINQGQNVLLEDFIRDGKAEKFNIEPNIVREKTAKEITEAKEAEFDVENRNKFVTNVFDGVQARGGAESGNNKKITDSQMLLDMVDLSTAGSYADQRNALLRFLKTFGLQELDIDLYNRFEAAIKGGKIPATEVVASLTQSGILARAMSWSQQLNNTEVKILKDAGNQLFLTKEGQILLATINKRDAEIKNEIYEMYLEGMKNKEDTFDLAVRLEEERIRLYDEFGNSDEIKEAISTITGMTGIQDRDFFAKQGSISIDEQNIDLLKAFNNEEQNGVQTSLVFGGYADQKTREFIAPNGKTITITRPELPVYFIKVGASYHLKQFDLDGPDE